MAAITLFQDKDIFTVNNKECEDILNSLVNPTDVVENFINTEPETGELRLLSEIFDFPFHQWDDNFEKLVKTCYIIYNNTVRSAVLYVNNKNILTCLYKSKLNIVAPLFPEDGDVVYTTREEAERCIYYKRRS